MPSDEINFADLTKMTHFERRLLAAITDATAALNRIAAALNADVEDRPAIIDEPPVGSRVMDREGDFWTRRSDGWHLRNGGPSITWKGVCPYEPLTLVVSEPAEPPIAWIHDIREPGPEVTAVRDSDDPTGDLFQRTTDGAWLYYASDGQFRESWEFMIENYIIMPYRVVDE